MPQQPGWVALDLSLNEFAFLEKNYDNPMNEIAALLSAGDSPRFYPVRWGEPHRQVGALAPDLPDDDDRLRIYLNTERAQAFVVVGGAPAYCREASAILASNSTRSARRPSAIYVCCVRSTARTPSKASRCFAAQVFGSWRHSHWIFGSAISA